MAMMNYAWEELASLWNGNDFRAVHDWLNSRWSEQVKTCLLHAQDPEAQFLQGLAFAALAFYFTQHRNQEGALLLLNDALIVLSKYAPSHQGVAVEPILESLIRLRPLLIGLDPEAECPLRPLVYNQFRIDRGAMYANLA